jgi:hypothetical protein
MVTVEATLQRPKRKKCERVGAAVKAPLILSQKTSSRIRRFETLEVRKREESVR